MLGLLGRVKKCALKSFASRLVNVLSVSESSASSLGSFAERRSWHFDRRPNAKLRGPSVHETRVRTN
jgi:hypothetical protein